MVFKKSEAKKKHQEKSTEHQKTKRNKFKELVIIFKVHNKGLLNIHISSNKCSFIV